MCKVSFITIPNNPAMRPLSYDASCCLQRESWSLKVQYASMRISLSKNKSAMASHGAVVCADYPSILVGAW